MSKNLLAVQVLQRAMDVLEVVGSSSEPVSLKKITEQVGLPKSTVYRLLSNLEARSYICCGSDGFYRLGLTIYTLGQRAERGFELKRLTHRHMVKLNEFSRESVHLGVLEKDRVLYLDSVDSPHTVRLVAKVGGTNSVHCTSLGKALLIVHSDVQIQKILAEAGMAQRTPYTIATPDGFEKEMALVRKSGFALDDRESGDECFCIGAPIYNHLGQVIAAISISGPASRVSRYAAETQLAPKLLEVTKAISKSIGYHLDEASLGIGGDSTAFVRG